ncbi:MAG: hypothetical protein IID34_01305 [Planctomycetes bacterium]|nr:hypothetical protein [Planctomycetota bacterium]MCH8967832.1 hypothetical protein [Planctomycetota bacterium]
MRFKRLAIMGLVCLNLVLLAGLVILSYDLPEALAQQRGGGKYAVVTAQYTGGSDALYVLHTQKKVLLAIIPAQNQSGRIGSITTRDVSGDLGQ